MVIQYFLLRIGSLCSVLDKWWCRMTAPPPGKFKLVTVSIATADMPSTHAVNREYLMLIAQHYPEFRRFVALLRGDFDKQNEALLAQGYMRTVFRYLHFCELHICLRESRTLIYRPCTRRYAMIS